MVAGIPAWQCSDVAGLLMRIGGGKEVPEVPKNLSDFLFMGRKQKSSNVRNKNGFADMIREMDEVSSMTDKAAVVTSGKVAGSSFSLLEVSNISSMVDKSAENIQPLFIAFVFSNIR
ncbi:hypothetical protein Fot_03465 [Forsythia ovata]|uniref:Uncharacterized protein n=1 Tax=Forsythia ovata TaxID=205694 RepID=A0ABD1XAE5_9LAMI